MTDSEIEIENITQTVEKNINLPHSESFYKKIYNTVTKDPSTAISSICVLFILVVLTLIIYKFFY